MAKFQIDDDLVRNLSKLLEETGLCEIEFEAEGKRIRVSRAAATAQFAAAPAPVGGAPAAETGPVAAVPAANDPRAVKSPIVGTVYTAAKPGAPAFVKVGDKVKEGQTILIVEAMKTMNPILAPHGGTIADILVENGDPVEFGAVLMLIE